MSSNPSQLKEWEERVTEGLNLRKNIINSSNSNSNIGSNKKVSANDVIVIDADNSNSNRRSNNDRLVLDLTDDPPVNVARNNHVSLVSANTSIPIPAADRPELISFVIYINQISNHQTVS